MLADGKRPSLESLCLHGNDLSNASIDKLAEGKWLLLRVLGVYYHWLKASAVNKLLSDQWPLLKMLELPWQSFCSTGSGLVVPWQGSWELGQGYDCQARTNNAAGKILRSVSFLQLSTPERLNGNLSAGESVLGLLV